MKITVYSKTGRCVACDVVQSSMLKKAIPFEKAKLEEHPEIMETAASLGLMSAPVVQVQEDDGTIRYWSGPNRDEIKVLETALTSAV